MALAIQANSHQSPEDNSAYKFGITEILIPGNAWEQDLVLPMLAHLSRQNSSEQKWFTWISPQPLTKDQLERFDFNCTRIRWIKSTSDAYSLWLLWEALSNGNSDTVVAIFDKLNEAQRSDLEQAAEIGKTKGIVLRDV